MSSFVSLEDVKKIYQMGEVQIMAAAGIDFQIERGEFAVVVGPSGAGKTTVSEYSWRNGYGKLWASDRRRKRYCTVFTETIDSI